MQGVQGAMLQRLDRALCLSQDPGYLRIAEPLHKLQDNYLLLVSCEVAQGCSQPFVKGQSLELG